MTAPITVAPEEARKDYIATCFKMSHAQLFQELMRVHQAAGQLMDEQIKRAVETEREECAKLFDDASVWDEEMSQMIRARGQDGIPA